MSPGFTGREAESEENKVVEPECCLISLGFISYGIISVEHLQFFGIITHKLLDLWSYYVQWKSDSCFINRYKSGVSWDIYFSYVYINEKRIQK